MWLRKGRFVMSFLIEAKNEKIRYKYSDRLTPYFSSMSVNSQFVKIFSGEFHTTQRYFETLDWQGEIDFIKDVKDSFLLVTIDKLNKKIYFANSKYGIEPLYYACIGKEVIISDDFWEVANLVCKSIEDIDIDSVKEIMNGCYPIFDGTFIKYVKVLNPAHVCTFDFAIGLRIEKYFEVKYNPDEKMSVEEVRDSIGAHIDSCIEKIKIECGDVKYAYGLSGGLDSRLLSYYTRDMKIESFIIGNPKPHKLFLARDHYNARKLAEIYKQPHTECAWNKEIFSKIKELDLRYNPTCTAQFFKGQYDTDFDILITGGNGYIVGSTIPDKIKSMSTVELANVLRQMGRDFIPNTQLCLHINTLFRVLFKKKTRFTSNRSWFKRIYNDDIENSISSKLVKYIKEEVNNGKSNFDIYEEYFHIIGARNKFGGFESFCGTKRSFSIYNPHLFDASFTWSFESLFERRALKELIIDKMPQASYVKEQRYEGSIRGDKMSLFNKLCNIVMYVICGNGSEMVNSKFRYVRNLFVKDMLTECNWFYDIFPIKSDINHICKFDNKYAVTKIWKIKNIMDLLETKGYTSFLMDKEFEIVD